MKINNALSQVAQTVINAINADATLTAGSLGASNQFGGVVISPKGKPFEILNINSKNWQSVLGKPWHPSVGADADCLRQVGEAVNVSDGRVVRVVASDATYPIIQLNKVAEVTESTPSTASYGTETPALTTAWAAFSVVDGDADRIRKVKIIKDLTLSLINVVISEDSTNGDVELENWIVSLDPLSVDDLGISNFVETLINKSQYVSVAVNTAALFTDVQDVDLAFTKPDAGGVILAADMIKALDVLHHSLEFITAYVALGMYDETYLQKLGDYGTERLVDTFIDLQPAITYAAAITAADGLGINNYHVATYHFPFTAKDPYYGGRAIWGLSGFAFAAKAKGRNISTGLALGVHYSPAGVDLATIPRADLIQVKGSGVPDYNAMVKSRINKIGGAGSALFIDDALVMWKKNDYLRFQHVASVCDEFSKRFHQAADSLRHKPDGITKRGLESVLRGLGTDYVASGALVKPRDPSVDGDKEFWFEVTQTEFDLWSCRWGLCVTGVNRRTVGEPVLIK